MIFGLGRIKRMVLAPAEVSLDTVRRWKFLWVFY